MNQTEIITQIGYRFRTASRNFVTTDEIKAELNRSLDRLSAKIDMERTIRTVTINFTGNGSYAFSAIGITDFKKPIQLFDRTNDILYKRVSRAQLYQGEDSSLSQYSISSTGLDIEGATSATTLTFTYYSTFDATDVTGATLQKGLSLSTDIPALQTRFHDFFVEDVSAVLFRKQRKFDDFQIARSEAKDIYNQITGDNPTQKEFVSESIRPYPENYD